MLNCKAFSRNRPQIFESMGYVKKMRMASIYDTGIYCRTEKWK